MGLGWPLLVHGFKGRIKYFFANCCLDRFEVGATFDVSRYLFFHRHFADDRPVLLSKGACVKFPTQPIPATFVRRYKRFFSDHRLEEQDEVVTASCPNTGRMTGLLTEGARSWISPVDSKTRKLKWDWHMIEAPDQYGEWGLVGMNTALPNKLVREGIEDGTITELQGYSHIRPEQRYGDQNSRIDFLLSSEQRPDCYVEVKNCHLRRRDDLAEFPDAVSARAAKHMEELALMVSRGHRAVVVFCVQRMDCQQFDVARDVDPMYDAAFQSARAAGVEVLAYACHLSSDQIKLSHAIEVL